MDWDKNGKLYTRFNKFRWFFCIKDHTKWKYWMEWAKKPRTGLALYLYDVYLPIIRVETRVLFNGDRRVGCQYFPFIDKEKKLRKKYNINWENQEDANTDLNCMCRDIETHWRNEKNKKYTDNKIQREADRKRHIFRKYQKKLSKQDSHHDISSTDDDNSSEDHIIDDNHNNLNSSNRKRSRGMMEEDDGIIHINSKKRKLNQKQDIDNDIDIDIDTDTDTDTGNNPSLSRSPSPRSQSPKATKIVHTHKDKYTQIISVCNTDDEKVSQSKSKKKRKSKSKAKVKSKSKSKSKKKTKAKRKVNSKSKAKAQAQAQAEAESVCEEDTDLSQAPAQPQKRPPRSLVSEQTKTESLYGGYQSRWITYADIEDTDDYPTILKISPDQEKIENTQIDSFRNTVIAKAQKEVNYEHNNNNNNHNKNNKVCFTL